MKRRPLRQKISAPAHMPGAGMAIALLSTIYAASRRRMFNAEYFEKYQEMPCQRTKTPVRKIDSDISLRKTKQES